MALSSSTVSWSRTLDGFEEQQLQPPSPAATTSQRPPSPPEEASPLRSPSTSPSPPRASTSHGRSSLASSRTLRAPSCFTTSSSAPSTRLLSVRGLSVAICSPPRGSRTFVMRRQLTPQSLLGIWSIRALAERLRFWFEARLGPAKGLDPIDDEF